MNPPTLIAVAILLCALAAAGVMAPLGRRPLPDPEPPADPLEDRRLTLLLSLKDLDDTRATGALREGDYERLRVETEARLARVLRALDERHRGAVRVSDRSGAGTELRTGAPRWAGVLLVAGLVLGTAVPGLLRSVAKRPPGGLITGDLATGARAGDADPLSFFEDRVSRFPRDLGARLDLAHRYLDAGRGREAIEEYLVALDLQPDNAEAHAHLGLVLHLAGRPREGLQEVERALGTEPRYPEALFFKGLILLEGLDRPRSAAGALRAYLESAPFGAEREKATRLLGRANARSGRSG